MNPSDRVSDKGLYWSSKICKQQMPKCEAQYLRSLFAASARTRNSRARLTMTHSSSPAMDEILHLCPPGLAKPC